MTDPKSVSKRVAESEKTSKEQGTLTLLLDRARGGDSAAQNEFCGLVYDRLCDVAHKLLSQEPTSHQSTSLVNDLFLQLLRRDQIRSMPNRRYFFAVATEQMRRILVDHHRRRATIKSGRDFQRVQLDHALDSVLDDYTAAHQCTVIDVEAALERIKSESKRQYDVIVYRFYGGLSNQETADLLEVSLGTVERDWRLARAKLHVYLGDGDANGPPSGEN